MHPSVPARSVAELVAMARSQPGKLSYSSCGNGSAMHLAGELFKYVAKLHAALNTALKTDDVRSKLQAQLFDVNITGPKEFSAMILKDYARWVKLVRDANIKSD